MATLYAAISADFPALPVMCCADRSEPTHLQFVQGFAGNVRPRIVADFEKGTFRASTPADLQEAGKQLANGSSPH